MADARETDRILPSLLDRFSDVDSVSQARWALSMDQFRACVRRDLSWLLNTTRLSAVQELDPYDAARNSVVNYGVDALAGRTLSGIDVPALGRALREAICVYEPRLIPDSIQVRPVPESEALHNTIAFEIVARVWAYPTPLQMLLSARFNLENGGVDVAEIGGSRA